MVYVPEHFEEKNQKEIKKITDESYNMDSAARLIQKLEIKLI